MQVATHDGSFHADDVFAIAALRLLDGDVELVRTRDPAVFGAADVRVDVGLRNDPETGDFDHHQKGGAGTRENGIPYASFGLVWRRHGTALCDGDAAAAAEVEAWLVQTVDAIDTGFTLGRPVLEGIRPVDVSDLVDLFNPVWDEEVSEDEHRERMEEAIAFAGGVLRRQIGAARARARARALVEDAIASAEDPRIVELDRAMPWQYAVMTGAPEALYVIYPKKPGDWRMHAVPVRVGDFTNRRDLPAAWAGLQADELSALTGVADARFCHSARFLVTARSQEGIRALARLALDEG